MNLKKLLLLSFLFIVFGMSAQEVDLTVKPVAKKKYDLKLSSQTAVTQSVAETEIKVNVTYSAKALMEIEEINSNGEFTTITTWNDVEVSTSAMGIDTTFQAKDMNIVMKTLYDKSGKIIKNERMDEVSSDVPALKIIQQIANNVKFPLLPAKTVKKGDVWRFETSDTIKTMEFPLAMVIDTKDEYSFAGTVTENGGEYYRINKSSPIDISGEGAQGGMDIHAEGTGMSESYSLLDKTTLFPVKIEDKSGMDMNIIISGPQPMAIPATQNVTTIFEFTEIK
ncbi:hypothetical protein [Proteiniphilum sp.]|uniref:hypothetical protein n=1 Tax=Proteiniphilum sp. TaxID=1926877 RepID=UPI002B21524E|nr:hypothetical protein [Proteiniphilum sp.]MEA4918621.1 hypothetical protein [Proteiniphilum sp.]